MAAILLLSPPLLPPSRLLRPPLLGRAQLHGSSSRLDTFTVFGPHRTLTSDAGVRGEDDYCMLELEVGSRAAQAVAQRRRFHAAGSCSSEEGSAEQWVAKGESALSARRGEEAERCFLEAVGLDKRCGAAWYGLGALYHEHQHGGLGEREGSAREGPGEGRRDAYTDGVRDGSRDETTSVPIEESGEGRRQSGNGEECASDQEDERLRRLSLAADFALVAARFEPSHPRALALLGDVHNDRGEHKEACRAWKAAELRGRARWTKLAMGQPVGAFGPRGKLQALRVGERVELQRSGGHRFVARRLAERPAAFVLEVRCGLLLSWKRHNSSTECPTLLYHHLSYPLILCQSLLTTHLTSPFLWTLPVDSSCLCYSRPSFPSFSTILCFCHLSQFVLVQDHVFALRFSSSSLLPTHPLSSSSPLVSLTSYYCLSSP